MAYRHIDTQGNEIPLPVSKVLCIGRNYLDHIQEMNSTVSEAPLLFMKPKAALCHMHEPIAIPTDKGLSSEGWDSEGTWGRQVTLTKSVPFSGLSKSNMKPLSFWSSNGVRRYNGSELPKANVDASLIMPDGEKGRIYLVYNNFHTLMKWNRSSYFGVSVGYLSERIKRGY